MADNGAEPGYPQTLALKRTSLAYQAGDTALAGLANVSIGAYDPDAI